MPREKSDSLRRSPSNRPMPAKSGKPDDPMRILTPELGLTSGDVLGISGGGLGALAGLKLGEKSLPTIERAAQGLSKRLGKGGLATRLGKVTAKGMKGSLPLAAASALLGAIPLAYGTKKLVDRQFSDRVGAPGKPLLSKGAAAEKPISDLAKRIWASGWRPPVRKTVSSLASKLDDAALASSKNRTASEAVEGIKDLIVKGKQPGFITGAPRTLLSSGAGSQDINLPAALKMWPKISSHMPKEMIKRSLLERAVTLQKLLAIVARGE